MTSQLIYGYVAGSLADVGNLDDPIVVGGQNTPFQKFQQINQAIEQKVSSVPYQERAWQSAVATQDNKPVIVLGIVHAQGTSRPSQLPDNLARIYSGQQPVDLPLKYEY